jgi:hypothetical protein
VGSTYSYQEYFLNEGGTKLAAETEDYFGHNKLDSRQFFMKLQYLFQL